MPRNRGVLFDLDDTLYPLRRFVRSGFKAVAVHLERVADKDLTDAFSLAFGRVFIVFEFLAGFDNPHVERQCEIKIGDYFIDTQLV